MNTQGFDGTRSGKTPILRVDAQMIMQSEAIAVCEISRSCKNNHELKFGHFSRIFKIIILTKINMVAKINNLMHNHLVQTL